MGAANIDNDAPGGPMKRSALPLAALLAAATLAYAATPLAPGTYTGGYELSTRTGNTTVGIALEVTEVKKDKVAGTLRMSKNGACDGEYPMAGTYKDGTLAMKSTKKSGRAGDCSFNFKAKNEGDKLVGKTGGGRELTLKK
jgi:hypothetical protein